jgi:hypothetical protein
VILCVNPTFSHLEQTLSTIRFGISAKKIENNVFANIVTNSDGEAVRILLSDYEKKLRDSEREREILKSREKFLSNKILECDKLQKAILLRLKMTQDKLSKKITNSVHEPDLEKLLMDFTDPKSCNRVLMGNVGILNIPMMNPYWSFQGMLWSKHIETLKDQFPDHFLGRESEAIVRSAFDSEGKFALEYLGKLKKEHQRDSDLMEKIEDNVIGFDEELEELGYKAKNLHELCENNIHKLAELVILCKEEFGLSSKLQKRLDLVEGLKGLGDLNNKQVDELEQLYFQNIESIKREKWKRELQEKILKYSEGSNYESNKQAAIDSEILKHLETHFSPAEGKHAKKSSVLSEKQLLIMSGVSKADSNLDEEEQHHRYFASLSSELKRDKKDLEELSLGAMCIDKEQIRECLFDGCEEIIESHRLIDKQNSEFMERYTEIKKQSTDRLLETWNNNKREILLSQNNILKQFYENSGMPMPAMPFNPHVLNRDQPGS